MARRFEMIEAGYEYRTEGYTIRKGCERVNLTHTGHITLDRYGDRTYWMIYPDDEKQPLRKVHTLKEAKQYIIDKEDK